MEVRKVWAFDDYALLMEDDPVELETLVRGIPIQVTEFFRDAEGWKVLRDEVLAPLVSSVSGRRQIRVWTAGCSTGEEAYSVGMLLDEVIRANGLKTDFQIFASDAAPELVARASRGIFREEAVATIPADLRERHFYRVDGAFRVRRLLRERMIFITQDLLSDPPFSEIDLVTCRNLLIYLEAEKVEDVLHLLHGSLQTRGVLFLGKSEPFQLAGRGFEAASQPWNIYRKTGPMPGARRKPAVSHRALTASTFAAVALRLARGYVSD
jgi:two-component system CheB/CheR fusion protein